MIPLLSTQQMRDADQVAVKERGGDALVASAGTAVALEAKAMMGSCYGKRVVISVGPGLNGADGRIAGAWLVSRGASVSIIEVHEQPASIGPCDLYIDAAFGLGCHRAYTAPRLRPGTLVLAVDLVSGVDADTGEILGAPLRANVTVALGALKYAHLSGPAAQLMGTLRFASLGIAAATTNGLLEDADLSKLVVREVDDHKWKHGLSVFAGSPAMPGAAELVSRGALAGGASMIRLATRGDAANFSNLPPEVVRSSDKSIDRRSRAVVAGPGLGEDAASWLSKRLVDAHVPVVLDADGLDPELLHAVSSRDRQWVLTPHEGEFSRLTNGAPLHDRIQATRDFARDSGCVVLLKGPTSIVSDPTGAIRIIRSGTSALATAGTGDVLAGLIGATIARGHDLLDATSMAAYLHGLAGSRLGVYAPASALAVAVTDILNDLVRVSVR